MEYIETIYIYIVHMPTCQLPEKGLGLRIPNHMYKLVPT